MRKKLKWYWKLLIIAFLMFIVGSCNHGFIVNTYAEEKFNRKVVFYNNLGIEQSPDLLTGGVYISNYLTQTQLDKMSTNGRNPFWYIQYYKNIDTSTGEVLSGTLGAYNTYYLQGNKTLSAPNSGTGNFIHKIFITMNNYGNSQMTITKGHQYTILLEFSRDNNLFYKRGSDYTIEDLSMEVS